jgi:uncharacterized protein
MPWAPGTAILWRSVWGGVVDVAMPTRVVRDDDDLIALYLCPGTRYRRRTGRRGGPTGRMLLADEWTGAYEEVVWHTNRALFLRRPGAAHAVGAYWREADGAFVGWYVNLEAPERRTPLGIDTWDHVLDLVVAPDLTSWRWKDEDEFAWAQAVGLGPDRRDRGALLPIPRRLGAVAARPDLDGARVAGRLAGGGRMRPAPR